MKYCIALLFVLVAGLLYSQTLIPFNGNNSRVHLVKTNAVIGFRVLTNSISSGNTTEYTTSAFTPTLNALGLCVGVTSDTGVPDEHAISSLHGNWLKLASTPFNTLAAGTDWISIWYCKVTNAVSSTLTNKFAGAATGCILQVVEFTGVDMTDSSGISAIRQFVLQTADATPNASTALNSAMEANTRSATLAIHATGDANPASITNEVNWTTIADIGYNTPATGLFTTFQLAHLDSGITFTNNATQDRAVAILEIRVEP